MRTSEMIFPKQGNIALCEFKDRDQSGYNDQEDEKEVPHLKDS